MPRKLKGLRRKGDTWQTYVRVHPGPGGFKSQVWHTLPSLEERREWEQAQRDRYGASDPTAGSFRGDIETYLALHAAMPTVDQRQAHLALWAKELGRDRPARTITSAEIELVLQGWLKAGVAPGTVLKRRTALQSFFGGKTAKHNPVRGTARPAVPNPEARAIDYLTIAKIHTAMPTYQSITKGQPLILSRAKLIVGVLAYTGLPPGLLATVRDTDLQLTAAKVRIRPRRKGKGVEARTLPLTAEGVTAFTAFHAAHAYGPFAIGSVNVAFKRAATRIGLDPQTVHLYDLRHSFLTELYRVTHDLATVARFGLHAEGSPITQRYAKGANQDVDAAAAVAFSTALADQRRLSLKGVAPVHGSRKKLPGKVARFR